MTDATDRLPQFVIAGAPEGRDDGAARGAGHAPGPVPLAGQGAEVLPHRRPAAAAQRPARPGRRAQRPGVDLAAGGLPGALRRRAGRHRPRGEHAVLPLRPGGAGAAGRRRPRDQGDRRGPRPGRPRLLQLGAPARRRAGAGGRLRGRGAAGGAPDRRRLGAVLALPRAGAVRRAAARPVPRTSPGTGSSCCATASSSTPRGRRWTGSARSSACRPASPTPWLRRT